MILLVIYVLLGLLLKFACFLWAHISQQVASLPISCPCSIYFLCFKHFPHSFPLLPFILFFLGDLAQVFLLEFHPWLTDFSISHLHLALTLSTVHLVFNIFHLILLFAFRKCIPDVNKGLLAVLELNSINFKLPLTPRGNSGFPQSPLEVTFYMDYGFIPPLKYFRL